MGFAATELPRQNSSSTSGGGGGLGMVGGGGGERGGEEGNTGSGRSSKGVLGSKFHVLTLPAQ